MLESESSRESFMLESESSPESLQTSWDIDSDIECIVSVRFCYEWHKNDTAVTILTGLFTLFVTAHNTQEYTQIKQRKIIQIIDWKNDTSGMFV